VTLRGDGWVGRKDRHLVEVDAVLHRSDGSKTRARLTDLSDEGCRIEADSNLRIGERLQISMPRMGQVKAQVRWALPGSAGAKFLVESDF
jgi:hypothetical protein